MSKDSFFRKAIAASNGMKLRLLLMLMLVLLAFPSPSPAQEEFGKNKVVWEKGVKKDFRQTEHFDIWTIGLDLKDPAQEKRFNEFARHLEDSYVWIRGWLPRELDTDFKGRKPVIVYRTQSEFENTHIEYGFIPEGVAGIAEPLRNRSVFKLADYPPDFLKTAVTHELNHIFQFHLMHVAMGGLDLPTWIIEGGAQYLAAKYMPVNRDDSLEMDARVAAGNPQKDWPTLDELQSGRVNPYVFGEKEFEFLEGAFGEDTARQFLGEVYKGKSKIRGEGLLDVLERVTKGKINSPEVHDRMLWDFWGKKYAIQALQKPKPYEETANFKGRSLTPQNLFYPVVSPVISPDGKEIVSVSGSKDVLALVKFPVPEEPGAPSVKEKLPQESREVKIQTLTPYPPVPLEEVTSQRLGTGWQASGSDVDWSKDGEYIAYFARVGRDHALVVARAKDGKIKKIFELPLDQAFTPAFSTDRKTVYFSAAEGVTHNIYAINLEAEKIQNLTKEDGFEAAPAVSPDGTKLAYVKYVNRYSKLFMLDLTTGAKEQITFNAWNDDSPSFSADGKSIVYVSDEGEKIWNLYTMDLATKTVRQWTDFPGGVFTPKYFPGKPDVVYYSIFWQYAHHGNATYPNFEVYEAKLKEPLRQFVMEDKHESMQAPFRIESLFGTRADENQVFSSPKPPRKWNVSGRSATLGVLGGYYKGVYSNTQFYASPILEDEHYGGLFGSYGSSFWFFDVGYWNEKKKMNWGWNVWSRKLFPLSYLMWDPALGYPKQVVLTETLAEQRGASFSTAHLLNKFNRFEVTLGMEQRRFAVFGLDEGLIIDNPEFFAPTDRPLFNFLTASSGSSVYTKLDFVRDTIIYSPHTQGPLNGVGARFGVKIAPPGMGGFVTTDFDLRKYFRLSRGSLFAVTTQGLVSSRENGDLMFLGGYRLRGLEYDSIVGNQAAYASAELRFPLVDAIVFPRGIAVGQFRGLLFVDAGAARFNDRRLPGQKGLSFGGGVQLFAFGYPLNFIWTKQNTDHFSKLQFKFLLTQNW